MELQGVLDLSGECEVEQTRGVFQNPILEQCAHCNLPPNAEEPGEGWTVVQRIYGALQVDL